MDLDRIAGIEPPVDESAVQAEVEAYVGGVDLQREPWRIENLNQADWAMRRLAETTAARRQYQDEVDLWNAIVKKMERAGDWFEERLKEWGVTERERSGRKTSPTAHGTVSTRKSEPKIAVADELAAIAWARERCPDAVKKVESFLVSRIGDAATIGVWPIGWEATNKETGLVERIPTTLNLDDVKAKLDVVRARLGDGYVVEVITEPAVVDVDHNRVPGLTVTEGAVTATVTPLGL